MKLPTIALIAVVFLSGCATQTEVLTWSTGKQNWVVGHYNEIPRQYSIHEFIREGGDIKNWTELVTVQNFTGTWGGASVEEAYNNLKAIREKRGQVCLWLFLFLVSFEVGPGLCWCSGNSNLSSLNWICPQNNPAPIPSCRKSVHGMKKMRL
jgi:hypothetical protein